MGISSGGMNDMWLAWVFKETDPQSSQRGCRTSWASALSQEPGGGQGWLKVTQWPAGSQAGPMPGPQAPPSLQTQICWSGEEGELVSNSGLHRAQRDCSLQLNNPPVCPVPGYSLPRVLLTRKIWCQRPQICVPSGGRRQSDSLAEWVDLKAQREVKGWGQSKLPGVFFKIQCRD